MGTGRRWHGQQGKYDYSESASVSATDVFPPGPEWPIQPLGGMPIFKPLSVFPVGVERTAYTVPPELLAESQARIARTEAKRRKRRAEEALILKLLH